MAAVSGPTYDAPRVVAGYQLVKKLGSGLQGKVYSARHTETGELVAVKLLDQDALRASAKIYLNLQREITAMQRVAGHPHVVGLKSVAFDVLKPHKKRSGAKKQIMLVLELAPGGELFSYLMLGKFDESIARAYWCQLLEALIFAHSKGVAHRDLKPENLLLDSKYQLKVGDWGLSAVLAEGAAAGGAAGASAAASALLRTQCGTRAYMAPEVLRGEVYQGEAADVVSNTAERANSEVASEHCCRLFRLLFSLLLAFYFDCCSLQWSAGILLFIMIAGFPPFQEAVRGDWWYDRCHEGKYHLFWAAHERSASFSPAVKDLINSIFCSHPAMRYKLEDCLKHPWTAQDSATPDAVRGEMASRRKKINASTAGDGAMDEVEAAEQAALMAAAGMAVDGATTATTATGVTLDASTSGSSTTSGAGAFVASSNEVSMDGGAGGGGFDFSADPFARNVTRGFHAEGEVSSSDEEPAVPPMPLSRPAFGPKIFTPPASLVPPIEAVVEESSDDFLSSFAAFAVKASITIADDAKAEETTAAKEGDAAEEESADNNGNPITSFPVSVSSDVTPAVLARAIAGYLDSTMQATIGVRVAEGTLGGIKLKASIPPAPGAVAIGGPIRCDVKILSSSPAGATSGRQSNYTIQVQRTGGDILSFGRVYARLKRAFTAISTKA
jgi:serine/threonine protein kinase